jgi:hypothetical protein
MDGSGSGSVQKNYGSGSGSGRPKTYGSGFCFESGTMFENNKKFGLHIFAEPFTEKKFFK